MSEFKTTAEAQQELSRMERQARDIDGRMSGDKYSDRLKAVWREDATQYRSHAARIRALIDDLIPNLPE